MKSDMLSFSLLLRLLLKNFTTLKTIPTEIRNKEKKCKVKRKIKKLKNNREKERMGGGRIFKEATPNLFFQEVVVN